MEKLKEMTRSEQLDYWIDQLCNSIARGGFRAVVNDLIDYYQRDAYERGCKQGAKKEENNAAS